MWTPVPSPRELPQIDGNEGELEERVGLPQTWLPNVATDRGRAACGLVAMAGGAPFSRPLFLCRTRGREEHEQNDRGEPVRFSQRFLSQGYKIRLIQ
jgi:hypothetical protein